MKAIAAIARNRVIGRNGRIPWRIPDELRWFKKVTTGHTVVMGRKTWESLGRPLPNRRNVVISRTGQFEGVDVIRDLQNPAEWVAIAEPERQIWVIGGSEIYRQLLPHCSELYLTLVPQEPEGDAWFPPSPRQAPPPCWQRPCGSPLAATPVWWPDSSFLPTTSCLSSPIT